MLQDKCSHYHYEAFAELATLIQLWSSLPDNGNRKREKLEQWLKFWPANQWLTHQPEKLVLALANVHDMLPAIESESDSKTWLHELLKSMTPQESKAIKYVTLACIAKSPKSQLAHLHMVHSTGFRHPHLFLDLEEELHPFKGGNHQKYQKIYQELLSSPAL